jgi:hypothetical protein
MRLNTLRTLLVWGGGEEYWTRAVKSQEKESKPIKVASKVSRVGKAMIEANTIGEKTKAPKMRTRMLLSP